ncbi:MAG: WD40 repeat domain-containing protein [Flammeovirgaceae bacterium]|nr:WD40 repeat domain-containing protein [Flammeovirgaceae bacterium]
MNKIQVTKIHTFTGHRDCVYTLERLSGAAQFFSAAGDGMIVLWNLETLADGQLIAKVPNSVYALHYHPASNLLIAGQNAEGVHLLDWQSKKEKGSLQLGKRSLFDIKSVDDFLFIAMADGSVVKVDLYKLQVIASTKNADQSARTIGVNFVKGELAIGYSDHFIRIFDFDLNLKYEWKAHINSVFTLRYSADGNYLLSGSRDARLKLWDVNAMYLQVEEIVAHMYAINHIEFSPDGSYFATCSLDKSIKVWDTSAMKLLKVIDRARHAGHGTSVNKLYWSAYENRLVSASDDRTISVWNIIF